MSTLVWKVAALLISVPTALPFSGVGRDSIMSPMPGHRVTGMTCAWGEDTPQWLTISWWQDTLPPYPGQPIEILESWQVTFLDHPSTASHVRPAGSSAVDDRDKRDNSYFLFASGVAPAKAFIRIAAKGMSREEFTKLVEGIRLKDKQPLQDEALVCETVEI